jgi:DNA polymerase-3 subunit epsilon
LIKELKVRIDPQRSIQAEAQRVHGISHADLVGCSVWVDVAPRIRAFYDEADITVAHNGKFFDQEFLNHEFQLVKLPKINKPLVDTMLDGRWATPLGKVPNLGELCFACNVDYDTTKAHAADYDVKVMMESFFNAFDWGFFKIEELK